MDKKDELEMFVLDDVYEVIEIGFLNHKIKTVIDEYQNIWISVESICDHLKIDSEKEIESLIDSDLDVWILKVFDSTLGKYNLFMINIDSIKLWLNTIHFNHIKFESRGILIKYRSEIIDIIKTAIDDKKIVTDRVIEDKKTYIIEDHFEGEELVGRVVIETEGDENKDEGFQYGGAKRPVIEVEEKGIVKCDTLEEEKDEEKMRDEIVKRFVFEGHDLSIVEMDGKPYWIAREVGRALGYSGDGKGMLDIFSREWIKEFDEGDDFVKLVGQKLIDFKRLLEGSEDYSLPQEMKFTSQVLLLTKEGIFGVLQLTKKEEGRRMRKWLRREVLPSIEETGGYSMNNGISIDATRKQLAQKLVETAQMLIDSEIEREEAEKKVLRLKGKIEEDKEYVNLAKTYEAEGSIKLSKFVHEGDGMGRLKYTFGEKIIYKYAEYHGMIKWGSMDNKMKWLPRSKYREWFAMVRDPIIAKKGRELHVTGYGRRKLVDFILNDPDAKYWSREKGSAELRRKYLRRNKDNQLSFKDKTK